jgi:hypothetical protein
MIATVLNGDGQDQCQLSSPFAGPTLRFASSPLRRPPGVFAFEWALSCRMSSLVQELRTRVFFRHSFYFSLEGPGSVSSCSS